MLRKIISFVLAFQAVAVTVCKIAHTDVGEPADVI